MTPLHKNTPPANAAAAESHDSRQAPPVQHGDSRVIVLITPFLVPRRKKGFQG